MGLMKLALAWVGVVLGVGACGGSVDANPFATGGTSFGGNGTGGSANASSGGASTGGAFTGGTSSGGFSTGGNPSGGFSTGGNSSGGTSTGGAPTGGTGGVTGTCPASIPVNATSCAPNGLNCSYGDCCPTIANCSGGVWKVYVADCPAPMCPTVQPVNGSACRSCDAALQCRYGNCAAGTTLESLATCAKDSTTGDYAWQIISKACPSQGVTCGKLQCLPGQICVVTEANIANQYACKDNPCSPNALDCSCAGKLCNVSCQVQGPMSLLCYCPTCG